MIFSPKQSDLESPTAAPKKTPSTISEKLKEATQPHSILQVPSLASSNRSVDGESHSKAGEKAMQWREEAEMQKRAMHSPTISYPMAGRPMHHPETPLYMGYRLNELAYAAEGLHFYPESPLTMRHLGIPGGLPGYGRRFSGHHDFEFGGQRVALHHSPRLHSGRGAMRLAAAPRVCATPDQMAQRRPSFPVSNRGKGNRINCSLRANLPSTASSVPTSICEMNTTPIEQHHSEESMGSQRFSEKVAERVAVAVSKKTKRKLPISSSKVESDKQQENDSEAKGAEQEFKVEAKRPKQETKPDVESAEQERISEAGSKKQQETEVESDKKASEPKETESRVEEETEKDENRVEEV